MKPTLKQLYAEATGDAAAHQRSIAAAYERLERRAQRAIRGRLDGRSWRQIAAHLGVSHATVASRYKRAMEGMRKNIAGEPRYNRTGRKKA